MTIKVYKYHFAIAFVAVSFLLIMQLLIRHDISGYIYVCNGCNIEQYNLANNEKRVYFKEIELGYISKPHDGDSIFVNKIDIVPFDDSKRPGTVIQLNSGEKIGSRERMSTDYEMISPSGDYWLTVTSDNGVHKLAVRKSADKMLLVSSLILQDAGKEKIHPVALAQWSSDEKNIAVSVPDGSVWLWKWETDQRVRIDTGYGPVFSPDGKRLAFSRFDSRNRRWCRIYQIEAGSYKDIRMYSGWQPCSWSPDGKYLLVRYDIPKESILGGYTDLGIMSVESGKIIWRRKMPFACGANYSQYAHEPTSALWVK